MSAGLPLGPLGLDMTERASAHAAVEAARNAEWARCHGEHGRSPRLGSGDRLPGEDEGARHGGIHGIEHEYAGLRQIVPAVFCAAEMAGYMAARATNRSCRKRSAVPMLEMSTIWIRAFALASATRGSRTSSRRMRRRSADRCSDSDKATSSADTMTTMGVRAAR